MTFRRHIHVIKITSYVPQLLSLRRYRQIVIKNYVIITSVLVRLVRSLSVFFSKNEEQQIYGKNHIQTMHRIKKIKQIKV